jgi:hypothetical protein
MFISKKNSILWLVAVLLPLLLTAPSGNAWGQTLAASLSSSGTQSLDAGASFSNGGTVTITASGITSGNMTISSITISVGNPGIFSSLTLNASSPNGSETDEVSLESGNNTITLSSISLANGQTATFTLSGAVSSTPAGSSLVRSENKKVRLASMFSPGPVSGVSLLLLWLAAVVMLAAGGKLRRWHLIAFGVFALMAATAVGCGNTGSGSSDQQAVSFAATASDGSAITVTGVPLDMGTITINGSSSSSVTGPTASPT